MTTQTQQRQSYDSQKGKHIIILGAGITGLSTALALSKSLNTKNKQYHITIIAAHFPGDESIDYTSPWAGGDWSGQATSSPSDAGIRDFDIATYKKWTEILSSSSSSLDPKREGKEEEEEGKETGTELGIAFKEARLYWGKEGPDTINNGDGSGLWWKDLVDGFEVLDIPSSSNQKETGKETGREIRDTDGEDQKIPEGAIMRIKYRTICINVPQHLKYHINKIQNSIDIDIIKASIDTTQGLKGVVRDSKRILIEKSKEKGLEVEVGEDDDEVFALINCTGLGARHFIDDAEAKKIFPIRGQTILVKGEASRDCVYKDFPDPHSHPDTSNISNTKNDELLYVIPRPGSGTTILGGSRQIGNWDSEIDEALNQRILDRIKRWELAEDLRTGTGTGKKDDVVVNGGEERDFEVLRSQVGLRPGRDGGPRVEVEGNERVEGVWVIHSYGHAGAGYQNSIGCSEKVVRLVEGLVGL